MSAKHENVEQNDLSNSTAEHSGRQDRVQTKKSKLMNRFLLVSVVIMLPVLLMVGYSQWEYSRAIDQKRAKAEEQRKYDNTWNEMQSLIGDNGKYKQIDAVVRHKYLDEFANTYKSDPSNAYYRASLIMRDSILQNILEEQRGREESKKTYDATMRTFKSWEDHRRKLEEDKDFGNQSYLEDMPDFNKDTRSQSNNKKVNR